jgi:hypothetical protein
VCWVDVILGLEVWLNYVFGSGCGFCGIRSNIINKDQMC